MLQFAVSQMSIKTLRKALLGMGLVCICLPLRASDGEVESADALINRVIPEQAKQFAVNIIPADNGRDVYQIESRNGKIILSGNNGVSIASALNCYLEEFCHCDVSWGCGSQLHLPQKLPIVLGKIRVVSPYRFRYAYNFCTHGYTMAWWDWPHWEQEIDFLAMSGINLALVIEGQEATWVDTFTYFGYSPSDIRAWVVDPAHLPWMEMDNMESYGGPLSPELVGQRANLGKKIAARMRELGIEPCLPGYYGMVPPDFKKRFPGANVVSQGQWGELKRPDILDPTDPMFAKIATAFYRAQRELFGGASFYAADPFHEGGKTNDINIPAAGRAVFEAMAPATWVLQSWQQNPHREMIDALDKSNLLVLDLWCENHENWRLRYSFDGTPWLWCTIHNFGGNVDMGGRLEWMSEGPVMAMQDSKRGQMSGIGALMEGGGQNPVLWELFLGNAWRADVPDFPAWLNHYVQRRYGAKIPAAEEAWKILADTLYAAPTNNDQYPINSVVCARPSLDPDQRAREWVSTKPYYDTARLVTAWKLLLDAAPEVGSSDGYGFDLCDVSRQVLANLATDYNRQIIAAYHAGDKKALTHLSGKMLGLIRDMDKLAGTRREFLLGTWIADAHSWGATPAEADMLEQDARELITVWTDHDNITDYANRQWNGLLGNFYYHRWQMWLEALNHSLANGVPINASEERQKIRNWELWWTRQKGRFPVRPTGNTVAIAKALFLKYSADAENAGTETTRESNNIK
jgi:alpha-N-acetylglucosaminidase